MRSANSSSPELPRADTPTGFCPLAQGWPRSAAYPGVEGQPNDFYPNGVASVAAPR